VNSKLNELVDEHDLLEEETIKIRYQLDLDEVNQEKSSVDPAWKHKATFCLRMKAARFNKLSTLIKEEKMRLHRIRTKDVNTIFVNLCRKEMDPDFFEELWEEAESLHQRQEVLSV